MERRNTSKYSFPIVAMIILVTVSLFLIAGNKTVSAASKKVTVLKEDETYSINLNGGKNKEKVKYTVEVIGDIYGADLYEFNLYINDKSVYSIETDRNYFYISTLDVNIKDRYQEIFIYNYAFGDSFFEPSNALIRFKNANQVKVYKYIKKDFGFFDYGNHGISSILIPKNTGRNKFYIYMESPYWSDSFGRYHAMIPFKLKGDKLVPIEEGIYDLLVPNYTLDKYTLASSMPLFKDSSGKKQIATLPAGTTFLATKVDVEGKPYQGYVDLYVKVKTDTGKTGWLFFPARENIKYLVKQPEWR